MPPAVGLLRVAVLLGGDSAEREISRESGTQAAAALRAAGHAVAAIDPRETPLDGVDWSAFDVAFLALHGGAGEDGRVQQWLVDRGVPFTGSGPTASRLAMSKSAAKACWQAAGLPTPEWATGDADAAPREIESAAALLGFPLIVKPDGQGSSFGLSLVRAEGGLSAAWSVAARYDRRILCERYVRGREFTVAILGRRALPVVEILGQGDVFDFHAKYASASVEHRLHSDLQPMTSEELQRAAVAAADALQTQGLVRVDMMLDGATQPWVLELNTLPGMTAHSLAPLAARAAGLDMPRLCDWMVRDALGRATEDGTL